MFLFISWHLSSTEVIVTDEDDILELMLMKQAVANDSRTVKIPAHASSLHVSLKKEDDSL